MKLFGKSWEERQQDKLEKLKVVREREEHRAKIRSSLETERKRISKAKSTANDSFGKKIESFGKGLSKVSAGMEKVSHHNNAASAGIFGAFGGSFEPPRKKRRKKSKKVRKKKQLVINF